MFSKGRRNGTVTKNIIYCIFSIFLSNIILRSIIVVVYLISIIFLYITTPQAFCFKILSCLNKGYDHDGDDDDEKKNLIT